jgi:hypothetical protein
MSPRSACSLLACSLSFVAACGPAPADGGPAEADAASGGHAVLGGCDPSAPPTRTASCVLELHLGPDGGFGMDRYPEVVFGPPHGAGLRGGSTDVLSLGKGGEIAVGFGGNAIVDGPGPDFIVFENAFYAGGDPTKPFAELGVVSVSEDGSAWTEFPCKSSSLPYDGCAGWHPVLSSPEDGISPYDPKVAGGDAFDLATLGLERARFVRVRDISMSGPAPYAGFDLDAVSIVNPAEP